jgi:hypothetical protein
MVESRRPFDGLRTGAPLPQEKIPKKYLWERLLASI